MELTEVSIDQMNELIGVFMGYKMYDKRYPRNHGIGAPEMEPEKCMIIQKAKYHASWDWLMPVVHILKTCFKQTVETKPDETNMHNANINIQLAIVNISNAHLAVYNAIQWYNQQINKPD